jgi:hypothetical protein
MEREIGEKGRESKKGVRNNVLCARERRREREKERKERKERGEEWRE